MKVDTRNRTIPVKTAYLRPRLTSKLTSRPANTTPKKFADMADQKGISRMEAMMAPVQAPVPGNGTATKSINPSHWNSSTGAAFSLALSNNISRNLEAAAFLPAKKAASFFRYRIMKGMGIMLLQIQDSKRNQPWKTPKDRYFTQVEAYPRPA